jgi:8-oxo-dGTP pyrophosphatase MutT (NUDIX family)
VALQFGVVPVRLDGEELRILLVTSRETRRWVVPRGNPIRNLSPEQSAAQEAYEEAGVRGAVCSPPIGSYRYDKKKRSGVVVPTEVRLFTMIVEEELDSWPERNQRERRWFAPDEAAAAVDEADLKLLLRGVPASLC